MRFRLSPSISSTARLLAPCVVWLLAIAACSTASPSAAPSTTVLHAATSSTAAPAVTVPTTAEPTSTSMLELGVVVLPTAADGIVPPQTTPPALRTRRLPTVDTLAPPSDDASFSATVSPLDDATVDRSTWGEGCPTDVDDLRYLLLTFWGFDDRPHQGEMIVHADAANGVVEVFGRLFEARFPIEEMRIVTDADLDALPTGDGNNTTAFVCRPVTGGTAFSQHAYGLAIDINPFLNPYRKGERTLPELATAYLDRSWHRPGMIVEGDVVHQAFSDIGWQWGGEWHSLVDYQHFSSTGR